MKVKGWMAGAGAIVSLVIASPASAAAPPTASCPGQELSEIAPVFRSELGGFVSFEARNPALEGWRSFGAEIDAFAHADRADCPQE
jgi:hypothetical protein